MRPLAAKASSRAARFRISRGRRQRSSENFANRQTADPLAKCYMPGVPRIMYMEFPFQIFQTRDHVAITFEWSRSIA